MPTGSGAEVVEREAAAGWYPARQQSLHGRAHLVGIAVRNTDVGLGVAVDRDRVSDDGQRAVQVDRPGLCDGVESRNRQVNVGGRGGGDVEGDVIDARVGDRHWRRGSPAAGCPGRSHWCW